MGTIEESPCSFFGCEHEFGSVVYCIGVRETIIFSGHRRLGKFRKVWHIHQCGGRGTPRGHFYNGSGDPYCVMGASSCSVFSVTVRVSGTGYSSIGEGPEACVL